MNRREQHVPGDPASAGGSGSSTAKSRPVFADALHARLDTAGARVRQECSHLDHVEAVASEYLMAARPPRVCD
ncbi:MAG: hypothetical protein HY084_08855 [Gemmatimonadetes bacterium]|nr:hypothetical protein [Gemmatimonadota bacterium]